MYSRDHTLTLTGPTSVADTSKAHMATQPLTFGPTQQIQLKDKNSSHSVFAGKREGKDEPTALCGREK